MGKILTLHELRSAREFYLNGIWVPDTMYGLLEKHAAERGDSYAIRDSFGRWTWSQLLEQADRVAYELEHAGLAYGDRVAVWLPDRREIAAIFLACSRNGYVCCPSFHENYTVGEVNELLDFVSAAAVFAQVGYGADASRHPPLEAISQLPSLRAVFALFDDGRDDPLPAGTRPYPNGPAPAGGKSPITDPDKVVYLAFTSGTTGKPKGVMHSDNTLLANGRSLVSDWKLGNHSIILSLSPMSHHIGTVALEQCLVAGCELAITHRQSGIEPIDRIDQTGATYVMGVPTHAMDLLRAIDARGYGGLGQVSVFYMAGAAIPRNIATRFLQLGVTPQNVYGMTENGSHQFTQPSDDSDVITSTCGKSCHGYEVKLWDENNSDLEAAPGDIGEIGGRGGLLMLGYFANQKATEQSFNASGWFMSGDLGRFDANGNLQIVGRKKDLIIRGGHNIHPARIEDLAHRHPNVTKAAAFSVPDERLGEKVCLAVICKGPPSSGLDLLQHLDEQGLSKFDMPEYFLVVDEFPLTASGKLLKRDLMAWARSGRISPQPVRFQPLKVET
jgi:acyl-CoA synthetase